MQHRGVPLLATRAARCARSKGRRTATATAAKSHRIRRVLSRAEPNRWPARAADDDDEPANDGRRSRGPARMPAPPWAGTLPVGRTILSLDQIEWTDRIV